MLIAGFYKIQSVASIDANTIHVNILLNKDHEIFSGHFPGNPVTPGVCMIQIIKEITEEHVQSALFLQRISNIKFMALINPHIHAELVLEMTLIQENNTVKVKNISKFANGAVALKCNGIFIKRQTT